MPMSRHSASSPNRRVSTSVQARRRMVLEVKTRRTTADRQRRTLFWKWTWLIAFWVILLTVLAVFAQTALEKFFFSNPDYNLAQIKVNHPDVLTEAEIRHLAGIQQGQNLFRIDLSAAERELARIPELDRVRVFRELPDTLRVELQVREPVAWVSDSADPPGAQPYLLTDAEGRLYRPRKVLPAHNSLPLIEGVRVAALEANDILHRQDLREALALLQTARFTPDLPFAIRRINIRRGYALEIITSEDTFVLFPIGEYPGQLTRLRRLIEHTQTTGRDLAEVNLVPQRSTPVRFLLAQRPRPETISDPLEGLPLEDIPSSTGTTLPSASPAAQP